MPKELNIFLMRFLSLILFLNHLKGSSIHLYEQEQQVSLNNNLNYSYPVNFASLKLKKRFEIRYHNQNFELGEKNPLSSSLPSVNNDVMNISMSSHGNTSHLEIHINIKEIDKNGDEDNIKTHDELKKKAEIDKTENFDALNDTEKIEKRKKVQVSDDSENNMTKRKKSKTNFCPHKKNKRDKDFLKKDRRRKSSFKDDLTFSKSMRNMNSQFKYNLRIKNKQEPSRLVACNNFEATNDIFFLRKNDISSDLSPSQFEFLKDDSSNIIKQNKLQISSRKRPADKDSEIFKLNPAAINNDYSINKKVKNNFKQDVNVKEGLSHDFPESKKMINNLPSDNNHKHKKIYLMNERDDTHKKNDQVTVNLEKITNDQNMIPIHLSRNKNEVILFNEQKNESEKNRTQSKSNINIGCGSNTERLLKTGLNCKNKNEDRKSRLKHKSKLKKKVLMGINDFRNEITNYFDSSLTEKNNLVDYSPFYERLCVDSDFKENLDELTNDEVLKSSVIKNKSKILIYMRNKRREYFNKNNILAYLDFAKLDYEEIKKDLSVEDSEIEHLINSGEESNIFTNKNTGIWISLYDIKQYCYFNEYVLDFYMPEHLRISEIIYTFNVNLAGKYNILSPIVTFFTMIDLVESTIIGKYGSSEEEEEERNNIIFDRKKCRIGKEIDFIRLCYNEIFKILSDEYQTEVFKYIYLKYNKFIDLTKNRNFDETMIDGVINLGIISSCIEKNGGLSKLEKFSSTKDNSKNKYLFNIDEFTKDEVCCQILSHLKNIYIFYDASQDTYLSLIEDLVFLVNDSKVQNMCMSDQNFIVKVTSIIKNGFGIIKHGNE